MENRLGKKEEEKIGEMWKKNIVKSGKNWTGNTKKKTD